MEIGISSGPSSNTSLRLTVDTLSVPSETPVPGSIPSLHAPEVLSNPKFALFQPLVLSIEKSNVMKKHLNPYCQ